MFAFQHDFLDMLCIALLIFAAHTCITPSPASKFGDSPKTRVPRKGQKTLPVLLHEVPSAGFFEKKQFFFFQESRREKTNRV